MSGADGNSGEMVTMVGGESAIVTLVGVSGTD